MATEGDGDYIAYVTGQLPALRRVATQLTGDAHRGDDLVQQAITRLYVHWRSSATAAGGSASGSGTSCSCGTTGRASPGGWTGRDPQTCTAGASAWDPTGRCSTTGRGLLSLPALADVVYGPFTITTPGAVSDDGRTITGTINGAGADGGDVIPVFWHCT